MPKVFTVEITEPAPKDWRTNPDFSTPAAFEEALLEVFEFYGDYIMDYKVKVTKVEDHPDA